MSLAELTRWTGEPGAVGALVVIAYQLSRVLAELKRLEVRIVRIERTPTLSRELPHVR